MSEMSNRINNPMPSGVQAPSQQSAMKYIGVISLLSKSACEELKSLKETRDTSISQSDSSVRVASEDIENDYQKAERSAFAQYNSAVSDAEASYNSATSRINQDFSLQKSKISQQRQALDSVTGAFQRFLNALPENLPQEGTQISGAAKTSCEKMLKTLSAKEKVCEELHAQLIQEEIDKKAQLIRQAEVRRDAELKTAKDKCKEEKTQHYSRQQRASEEAAHKYSTDYEDAIEKTKAGLAKMLDENYRALYRESAKRHHISLNPFECATTIPEAVEIGEVGIDISYESKESRDVANVIQEVLSDIGKEGKAAYQVRIPYFQRLQDGISLQMRFSPPNRHLAMSLMQPLLLKLFAAFPAGKIEATMIDPLQLGGTFSEIQGLSSGPETSRIIDTKVWSSTSDIEAALANLRHRIETLGQNYGNNFESRIKKEPIKALAITDFPVGFSAKALSDLRAIVRNAARMGVCVFICADDLELDKLKDNDKNLVDEIESTLTCVRVQDTGMVFLGKHNLPGVFMNVSDVDEINRASQSIISKIAEKLSGPTNPQPGDNFGDMYDYDIHDSNNWFSGVYDRIEIPIGIKGANTIVKMTMGQNGTTAHHALISGVTGAGKSTLFHTMIMSTMLNYSPDEVQMYLIDFKEGVEFSQYAKYRLPSLRVVAIVNEREYGLRVLQELCKELTDRARLFSDYNCKDINDFRDKKTGIVIPKLLLIFDEVQELFNSTGNDPIIAECLKCLKQLVAEGRALGIHIILACQNFNLCPGIQECFSNMSIRIAIRGTTQGAASILESGNKGITDLQTGNYPVGHAIYNGGSGIEAKNNYFQISKLSDEDQSRLLTELDAFFTEPEIAPSYEDYKTRLMLTTIEADVNSRFNALVNRGISTYMPISEKPDEFGLILGQAYEKKQQFEATLASMQRESLLVICPDESVATSIVSFSVFSILYNMLQLSDNDDSPSFYVLDFSDSSSDSKCSLSFICRSLPEEFVSADFEGESEAIELLTMVHNELYDRIEGRKTKDHRKVFIIFGLDRVTDLVETSMFSNEKSPVEMITEILTYGPQNGINCIVWGESLAAISQIIDNPKVFFRKRIACQVPNDDFVALVTENNPNQFQNNSKTAVFRDFKKAKNVHFRPYEVPTCRWAEAYLDAIREINRWGGIVR